MNKLPEKFDIGIFLKAGSDLVVELDDDVEYLLDNEAAASIRSNEPTAVLKRLIDGEAVTFHIERIVKALQTEGPIDYLKTR